MLGHEFLENFINILYCGRHCREMTGFHASSRVATERGQRPGQAARLHRLASTCIEKCARTHGHVGPASMDYARMHPAITCPPTILLKEAPLVVGSIGEGTKFGRYVLLEKIGAGGMAEIFRAKTFGAAGFEKEFAIKLILPSLVDDTEFVDMFINEAKIAVSLYHANVVQVFDLGELDNQYYIAMEFVHGKDLLDVLARCAELNIKIPLNLVLFIAMEMLKGLDFAHRAKDPYGDDLNIIHRDVSPSNILISYAGDVKV